MNDFIQSAFITCPRCVDTQPAARMILESTEPEPDFNLRRETLTLEAGRIKQSGHVEVIELGVCGCRFDMELWQLRVKTEYSTSSPGYVSVKLEPRFTDQPPDVHPDSTDLPDVKHAAYRVEDFLSSFGDGVIEETKRGHKLFARDVEALRQFAVAPGSPTRKPVASTKTCQIPGCGCIGYAHP